MLTRGAKEVTDKGVSAAKQKLEQMHSRGYFQAIAGYELTHQEKVQEQEGIIILNQKGCHIRGDLEGIGLQFSDYDPCEASRMVNK